MTLTARLDVSAVPLQGGYIAKKCPVLIQNRILFPELEDRTLIPEIQHRMEAGNQFEAEVFESLRAEGDGDWVVIPDGPRELAQQLTLEAMTEGVAVVEQAFLPADLVGRRTGRPDLLVFHDDGYVPIDIKHHRVLDVAEGSVLVSDAVELDPGHSYHLEGHALRANLGDALQLAHYRRMLEALGFASASMLAGVLGREGLVVWYDLSEPMWQTPAKSDGKKRKKRTSLERYDFEFGFRLDIAATAIARRDDANVPLLVEAMHSGECGECGYREHCGPSLREGSGDASLLPGLGYTQWRALRDLGIVDRKEVAALHYPTARLAESGVELTTFLDLAAGQPADVLLSALRPRATKQLEALADAGIVTVADLVSRIDPLTASIGFPVAGRILDSRAAIGETSVYRRPGKDGSDVPRADIEIDLDMENANEGVYLWGTFLTDRAGSAAFAEGYRPFISWATMDDTVEADLFLELWKWLSEQRSRAVNLGLSLRIYVYTAAEHSQMRRIATSLDPAVGEDIEELVGSDSWVDLNAVFCSSWVTGGSSSLKVIAPLAGYEWPVEDPGGGYAMVMYAEAISDESQLRDAVRQWVLEYNRGDVEATKQIREWLSDSGAEWPVVRTD